MFKFEHVITNDPFERQLMQRQRPGHKEYSHVSIAQQLGYRIRVGALHAGAMLPSRRMLAEEFGAAVGTVQKAIDELVSEGYVVVRGRLGTFVAGEQQTSPADAASPRNLGRPNRSMEHRLSIGIVAWHVSDLRNTELGNTWARWLIQEIENTANRQGGYASLINRYRDGGNSEPLGASLQRAADAGFDALIVIFRIDDDFTDPAILRMAARIPIVVVGADTRLAHPLISIGIDQRDAGCQAALHLLDNGVRRLMFLSHMPEDWQASWVILRKTGVVDAYRQFGMREDRLDVASPDAAHRLDRLSGDPEHLEAAYWTARKALENFDAIEGVVAVNDFAAQGFMKAAVERGLTAGRDYLIVGFDDAPRSLELGLSTLTPPLTAMGREAVRTAAMAARREYIVLRSYLSSHLAVRLSSIGSREAAETLHRTE